MLAKEPGSAPVSVTDSSEETKKPVTTKQLQETSKIKFDDLSCQKNLRTSSIVANRYHKLTNRYYRFSTYRLQPQVTNERFYFS
jgi:hypothetical protein